MKNILFFIWFYSAMCYCQSPTILCQKNYGGSDYDYMHSGIKTADGGFFYGGRSNSPIGFDITQNSTNLYGLHNPAMYDIWVVKTDNNGNLQWQRKIRTNKEENFITVDQTTDGGYVIASTTESGIGLDKTTAYLGGDDFWLLKLDSQGTILWQKELGGTGAEYTSAVKATSDGGCIFGGTSWSHPSATKTEDCTGGNSNPDYWVVKFDALGNIEWDNTIGGLYGDYLDQVMQTSDGGYMVSGVSNSNISGDKTSNNFSIDGNHNDFWLVKLNSLGVVEWDKSILGDGNEYNLCTIQSQDGGYLIAGNSGSSATGDKSFTSTSWDIWLLKLTSNGSIEWEKTIGGSLYDFVNSITQNTNGDYIIGSQTQSPISGDKTESCRGYDDFWIIKLTSNGTIIWDKTIGSDRPDYLAGVVQDNNDNIVVFGTGGMVNISGDATIAGNGGYDFWVVKLNQENLSTAHFSHSKINIFPNPTNGVINIDFGAFTEKVNLTLTNVLGQKIFTETLKNIDKTTFGIKEPDGIYVLEILNENNLKETFKIIKN